MISTSERYQSVFFDLKNEILNKDYSVKEISRKIYSKFKLESYPLLLNYTKNNEYIDARDALYSSEATCFYFVDLDLLKVRNKDELYKVICNKYETSIDINLIDKIFFKEDSNYYFDWNYFNLLILLIKNKNENTNKILSLYDGNLIESFIIDYDMYIDFKELFDFNGKFVNEILKVLFFENDIFLKKRYFNKYYFEKFKEVDKKNINDINQKNKKTIRYFNQIDNNLLNINKEYYYPESNLEIEKYSLFFGNCIDSRKFKLKILNNEISFVVNEKKMICFSFIDNILLELKGYDNKEILDESIINEVKDFINEAN